MKNEDTPMESGSGIAEKVKMINSSSGEAFNDVELYDETDN